MCHSGIHILFLLISYLQFWIMKHQSIDTWRKTSQECNTVLTSQYETLFWSFCVDITIWFVYPFKCISLIPFSRQRSGFINFMNDEERRLFWQKTKSLFWRKTVRKPKKCELFTWGLWSDRNPEGVFLLPKSNMKWCDISHHLHMSFLSVFPLIHQLMSNLHNVECPHI